MKKFLFALLVALTVSPIFHVNIVLAETEQVDVNKLPKFATGKADEVSKKIVEKYGLTAKDRATVELFNRHWVNLYSFKENEDKGDSYFVVGKVGGDEMEALSYSTNDVDKARAFIEDALKLPLDDELKALLEEKITKDTKEDTIYKTRKDEYSLIVKRTTEADTKARYAISVTTDKEVFDRLSK